MATVSKFHSILTQIEVKQGNTWKLVVAVADTGRGPTIFRMIDVAMAVKEYGMEEPCAGLVTADVNQLEGLCGSTAAVACFKGHPKEHTFTAQVIDRSRMTPILPSGLLEATHGSVQHECECDYNRDRIRRWHHHNRAYQLLE